MESPEHTPPEELSAEQAAQELDDERAPGDTDETEMTGTVDEELEDRGDV